MSDPDALLAGMHETMSWLDAAGSAVEKWNDGNPLNAAYQNLRESSEEASFADKTREASFCID